MKVYRVLQVGNYDLVKTFRAQRQDGFYRRTISKCYNFLFTLLYPSAHVFRDINSKPKIRTREAYSKMKLVSNDWFTDAEIMIEALKHNLSVGEVSTVFYKNERRGTFVPFRAIFEFLGNLIHYRFSKNPELSSPALVLPWIPCRFVREGEGKKPSASPSCRGRSSVWAFPARSSRMSGSPGSSAFPGGHSGRNSPISSTA